MLQYVNVIYFCITFNENKLRNTYLYMNRYEYLVKNHYVILHSLRLDISWCAYPLINKKNTNTKTNLYNIFYLNILLIKQFFFLFKIKNFVKHYEYNTLTNYLNFFFYNLLKMHDANWRRRRSLNNNVCLVTNLDIIIFLGWCIINLLFFSLSIELVSYYFEYKKLFLSQIFRVRHNMYI